jgi:hypothetical protein
MKPLAFPAALPASNPKGQGSDQAPPLSLGRLVRKSALLNAGIVLSALPMAALMGGPGALGPTGVLLAAVSVFLWAATFAAFSAMSLSRIFRQQASTAARRPSRRPGGRDGVADRWMDGPA